MRPYFKHLMKKSIGLLLFLTLTCLIIYVAPLLVENYYSWNWTPYRYIYSQPSMYLTNISVVLYLMAVLIPIILFSYKMNKRSVDMYYSLPLSKRKILLVNFLVGLILLYVPYTFSYLVGFIVAAVKVNDITLIYYLYLYLSSLIPAFTIYSMTAFVFTRANTIWDGLIAVAGVYCIFMLGALTVEHFGLYNEIDALSFFPSSPIDFMAEACEKDLFREALMPYYTDPNLPYYLPHDPLKILDVNVLVGGIIWTLIGVAMTVALFVLEPRSRAENSGQISDSPFGCKILLPIYTFLFPAAFSARDPLNILIIAFAAYALAAVYKRRFWIGWKYAVVLLGCLVAGMILAFI